MNDSTINQIELNHHIDLNNQTIISPLPTTSTSSSPTTIQSQSTATTTSMTINYSIDLLNKLNEMRNESKLCDYEIRVNETKLNAHKFILIAISDFFKAMLTGDLNR